VPRIAPSLARRIDRLSARAHRFHRFAHHPLCHEYQGELVQLGRRTRICRGCLMTMAGGALGCVAALIAPRHDGWLWLLAASLVGLAATIAARAPRPVRRSKVLTRLAPALGVAFGGTAAVLAGQALGALAIVAASAGIIALYRRRGPDRTPCATCPERAGSVPCRGIAPIVRRERAFQRLAGAWLTKAGAPF
jgi:hypothetical protein